jgi:STE24 endopeptidase
MSQADLDSYFYGLPWSKHIVIYDTLIEQSTPSEVEAVLGHELGHWYFCKLPWGPRRSKADHVAHPTKLLAIAQLHLAFTFTTFSLFIHNKSLFSSFHFDPRLAVSSPHGGSQPIMIGFMLYQLIFGPLDSIAQVLMHAQTRKYEFQAGKSLNRDGR